MVFEKIGNPDRCLIVGIGSVLVDFLVHEEDAFIDRIPEAVKGGMTLVDSDTIDRTLALVSNVPQVVPGGSACNMAVGVGNLGGQIRFIGKRGEDALGNLLENSLRQNRVSPLLFQSPTPTGRVLSTITPDAQRTLLTCLGAAADLSPEEVGGNCFEDAAVVYVEGYLLYNRSLIRAVFEKARQAGACICLDLASFTVVTEAADVLGDLVDEFVDILIANEDEARIFTGCDDDARAIGALAQRASLAALKVGSRGSWIAFEGQVHRIEPWGNGTAVDTTGAGDLWAAGFLFGLVNGFTIQKSGQIGSACGYEVCQVVGAAIPDQGWERIRALI